MLDWKTEIRNHLASPKPAPEREAEITEELAQHAEDRYNELLTAGLAEQDARRTSLDETTGHEMLSKELRAVEHTDTPEPIALGARRRRRLLSSLGQDIRYAFRTWQQNPGFTAIALAALALSIGANTAMFSVVNGVLLQPLNYPDPSRLVGIFERTPEFDRSSIAYPDYLEWRRQSHSFTDMGAFRSEDFNFTGSGQPEQLSGEYVSASVFPILGIPPFLGRGFVPEDDRQGAACVVVLGYGFWVRRFGGDRTILGKPLTLNASACSVIGVMPADFRFHDSAKSCVLSSVRG